MTEVVQKQMNLVTNSAVFYQFFLYFEISALDVQACQDA
jgi:hypothetical protein